MTAAKLKFSVFLPTLKRPDLLRKNLEALELQTRLPDEVLISLRGDLDPEGVAVVAEFVGIQEVLGNAICAAPLNN